MIETIAGFVLIGGMCFLQWAWTQRVKSLELRIIELKNELAIADIHRFTGLPSPAELEILRMNQVNNRHESN